VTNAVFGGWGKMRRAILLMTIVPFMVALSGPVAGQEAKQTLKEGYDLQERCGRRAAELFEKFYGDGISKGMISNYTCHYNRRLNKCFILLTSRGYSKKEKGEKDLGGSTDKGLWDVNENKPYAQFFKFYKVSTSMQCDVGDKTCRSEFEWDSLVRPYMEE
jgi:hypothetical protein